MRANLFTVWIGQPTRPAMPSRNGRARQITLRDEVSRTRQRLAATGNRQPANRRPNRHLQRTPAIPQDGQPSKLRKSRDSAQPNQTHYSYTLPPDDSRSPPRPRRNFRSCR